MYSPIHNKRKFIYICIHSNNQWPYFTWAKILAKIDLQINRSQKLYVVNIKVEQCNLFQEYMKLKVAYTPAKNNLMAVAMYPASL